jgi:cysteine-S-conjugate beta-lyase
VPGMVLALNVAAQTVGKAGDGIIMQTPVYGPFLNIPTGNQRYAVMADLHEVATGDQTFTYEIDYDVFERSIHRQTTHFFLCNPHNPAGRIFTRDEVARLADICLKHNLTICADEIHSDLLLSDQKHTPIASIAPEIAQRTITLIAPSKTFNVPGLACSIAIIPNKDLRKQYEMAARSLGVHVNIMGLEAAQAAYEHGDDWLKHLLDYLRANRDIPGVRTTVPEATYLAWLDCRKLDLPEGMSAYDFFLKEAKVALNPGTFFGTGYERFVRLNFACARSVLAEGLERMRDAVKKL